MTGVQTCALPISRGLAAGQILHVDDTVQLTADVIQFDGPVKKELLQKLSAASASDVPALLEEMLTGEDSEQFGSKLVRYYTLVSLLKIAVRSMTLGGQEGSEKETADQLSSRFDVFAASGQYDTFRQTAGELLRLIVDSRQLRPAADKYSHVMTLAENYVKKNFCEIGRAHV